MVIADITLFFRLVNFSMVGLKGRKEFE